MPTTSVGLFSMPTTSVGMAPKSSLGNEFTNQDTRRCRVGRYCQGQGCQGWGIAMPRSGTHSPPAAASIS
ncbi:hypothetical protein Pan216_14700 [Planctomycetes bacterium Pan216]|uniref:Uncharacterized protein n=1 Tax=Kolteria novifilia TaxID=2527975 RepID=A0A518B0W6_9BACT|nr:hypothetical protein Pan216_14700 [Planctomycetes bacterium Pan216]